MFIPLSFVNCYRDHRALHSFPIRRSSDLDLTFTHEHLATLGDTLALSHATMSFTELAADDLTFGATVLERFLVIETSAESDRPRTEVFAENELADAVTSFYERYAELLPEGTARSRAVATARAVAV